MHHLGGNAFPACLWQHSDPPELGMLGQKYDPQRADDIAVINCHEVKRLSIVSITFDRLGHALADNENLAPDFQGEKPQVGGNWDGQNG